MIQNSSCIFNIRLLKTKLGFPGAASSKNSPANAGNTWGVGPIPGSGRFPWRRKWQPTPFLPRKPHGQRSLAVHGVAKNWYRRLYKVKWIKEAADKVSWQVSSTFKVQCLERKSRTWNYWVKLVLGDFTECWEGVLVTNFIAFDSLCFGLGLIYILSINKHLFPSISKPLHLTF